MSDQAHRQRYDRLRRMADRRLHGLIPPGRPADLRDGCRHILAAGGKRVRSTLVLLSCEAVGGKAREALDAGAAIEIMHNFTLVHDDIMDNAPSRRGRPTVHTRWNLNTALLVGDILLGHAYELLLRTRSDRMTDLTRLFTDGLLEVCEGQALDLEFERRATVTVREYFDMIGKKTGKLISMAAEMGALIGHGTRKEVIALRRFGSRLGKAFQLQDDLLDVTADQATFGKSIGGDIIERKKTYLLLRAFELAGAADRRLLRELVISPAGGEDRRGNLVRRAEIIAAVTDLYRRTGVIEETEELVANTTRQALVALDALRPTASRETLRWFASSLVRRAS